MMISNGKKAGIKMVVCMLVACSLLLVGIPMTQAAEKTTLRIVDEFTSEPTWSAFQDVLDQFVKLNPDITIKREGIGLWESTDIMKSALRAGTGPDVLHYSGGPAWMGVLALGGLLLDLTEEYKKNNWIERLAPWAKFVLPQVVYDGKYWAIPYGPEYFVVYYNKRMFAEAGISKMPGTFEEMLTASSKLEAAGYQPMVVGNIGGYSGGHLLSWLWAQNDSREAIESIYSGEGSWENSKLIEGTSRLLTLYEKGYINKDANDMAGGDAEMLYLQEEAAMLPTGSWLEGWMYENASFEYSLFNPLPEGSVAVNLHRAFTIPAKTKHKDEALRLVDYLMTFEPGKIMLEESGHYPNGWLDQEYQSRIPTQKISQEMLQQPNPQYFCIEVSFPANMFDQYFSISVKLFRGESTPEEEMKLMQEVWQEAIDEGLPRLEVDLP